MPPPAADPPVFVFADDLYVHGSAREAGSYHELPDEATIKAIIDRHGNVLVFDWPHVTPVLPPENRRRVLVLRLRKYLFRLATDRPDLLCAAWVRRASGDDLIDYWCGQFYLKRRPPARRPTWWWPFR